MAQSRRRRDGGQQLAGRQALPVTTVRSVALGILLVGGLPDKGLGRGSSVQACVGLL